MQAQLMTLERAPVQVPALDDREICTRFLLSQDVCPSSKRTYNLSLRQYFAWLDKKGISLIEVTREQLLSYKQELIEKGLSSLTIGSYITIVRKLHLWLEENRICINVARGIKSPKKVNAFRKSPLTSQQARELLNYFEESARDSAIVNLLLRTGIRTIEAIRANIEDLAMKGGQSILYIQGKGRADRSEFVVITPEMKTIISDYLFTRGRVLDSDPLFASRANRNLDQRLTTHTIGHLVKRGLRAIGINDKSITCHSLRHTCAVSILKAGGSIMDARAVLRHSSTATTEIYTKVILEEQRLENPPEMLIQY